jgi:hypothetical protein
MNDENPVEKTDLSEVSNEEKEQADNKVSAPEADEAMKLQESFKRVHNRSDNFTYECDLKREAKQLGMEIEEYRRWYKLSSESPHWWPRFCRWAGFGGKNLWISFSY